MEYVHKHDVSANFYALDFLPSEVEWSKKSITGAKYLATAKFPRPIDFVCVGKVEGSIH